MRTKEEQEKGCPIASEGVSQEKGEMLRRDVPRKGEKASEGGSQESGKSITKGWPRREGEASERTSSQSTRPERFHIADT